jgi:sarcosine oxidase subunit alpha
MFRRRAEPRYPVTVYLDGDPIVAERGEPIAAALLAADKTILARSPKLHRPRGASCLRGGCDGCLARVDGVPNVMTCLVPARGGERVDAQNVIGSRKADLLRVTDWFFAQGLDHHHLMAGVPGLSDVMQTVASKVAGLGRLPSAIAPIRPATRLEVDVAIVGAGPTGLTAASILGARGLRVVLVDDGLALGGALVGAPARLAALLARRPLDGVRVLSRSTAAGDYDGHLLVADGDGAAVLVRAKATLFATGAHDGVAAFPGNDMPGIFSARALCRLVRGGAIPDGPVALVGNGFWAEELARALGELGAPGDAPVRRFALADVESVRGTGGVRSISARVGGKLELHAVAVVALALPGAPSFELAAQAGAETRFDPAAGYVVVTDDAGRAASSAWAAGECTGDAFDPDALEAAGERIAQAIARSL